jgi:aspartyl-tRNA(Asn)/glutamyl-tRNA(Gln) amidotransferase subunit A
MHHLSIREMSELLQRKKISSTDLTEHYLKRIKQHNPTLNAYVTITEELAREQAAAADVALANGTATPLTGIPIAHKDLFLTAGVRTSACSKMLDNFIAPYESTATQNLKNAGMVLLGKTNMDEFAMGSSNENSYYGPVKNPWDTARIPGGSSGGSAAAIAAQLAPITTGSDTGGSIRQPAALCGITGLRPSYGRVSRHGMIAFASSLDQGGLFARSAEDIAWTLEAMAGFDPKDSTSVNKPVPAYKDTLERSIKGLNIGLPKEYFETALSAPIAKAMDECISTFKTLGANIVEISLPHTHLATACYYVLAPAECSANLARFDGVRYGYRCDNPCDLNDLYTRSRSEGFGHEVKRRILAGTYVLSSGYYDAYYLQAQKVRRLIRDDFIEAYKKVDMILTPTTPTTAFKFGEKHEPENMYLSDIYTIAVNLAGITGLSMPIGFHEGLPIGGQLIGQHFEEAQILNAAHQYQSATDWHTKTNAFGDAS